jgi:hypothetical protein
MTCWRPRRHACRRTTGVPTDCRGCMSTSPAKSRTRKAAPSMPSSRCAPPSLHRLTPSSSWHARHSSQSRQASTRVANAWQAHGGCSHAMRKQNTIGQSLSGTLARRHASDPLVPRHFHADVAQRAPHATCREKKLSCLKTDVSRQQLSHLPLVTATLHIDLLLQLLLPRLACSSSPNPPLHTISSPDNLITHATVPRSQSHSATCVDK